MRAARHQLRQAVDSLYSRGRPTPESYTRLVLECVRAHDVDQARRLQSHMELHSFRPDDTYLHNRLLHLYARSGQLDDARKLFDEMPRRDVFSWNAMLSAHAKCGSVGDMWATFDEMPVRDGVSYNTVIAGFAGNGQPQKALQVFVNMHENGFAPTEYTHVSALNASSQLQGLRLGKQIHGRIVASNFRGSAFVWNALTDMYARCGEIHWARWLFDRMVDKNVVSWNTVISGYVINGNPDKCVDLFREMQLTGCKPDQITVSNVLRAYFQCGHVVEAGKLFDEIRERDKICWTTMIVGYSQSSREEDALLLFCRMLSTNVQPDGFTISSVVSSCAKLAFLCLGQAVHAKAILVGVDDDLLVSSALVDMYSSCGVIADARFIFNRMTSRNVVSWNAMIGGYAQNGQDLEALRLYEEMLQGNMKPDIITFIAVLSSCVHANLMEQGQKYFDSISKVHGITPTLDHYAFMVSLLVRSGQGDKALSLIKQMPHQPNSVIWSSILSSCATMGDIKLGKIAASHLFDLDPCNAGPYITLSNMYAANARWKDVASVRSLMKNRNVRKVAAYSWIEFDSKVHRFVSEDRSHPETDQIYEELHRLIKKLQVAGFIPNTKSALHDVADDEKLASISYHSEKLALAFILLKNPDGAIPIRIIKNIRVCGNCHMFMKYASELIGRHIILRDYNRYHHFIGGNCSCNDCW
ncbi:pentatricopeptide repeat-containing protein At4g21065-like [Syzygium oleosum]|uniref:pentatricopeptide repeat-containing protein At4g21065-like n=1 Tax=Syzygium oleosum TaxID=219896 RepID=UPI0024B9EB00|nr:pentatricopeptide repeat-containing protein At4g21065-like [Syzygium oleosum]XP_056172416.1 pentatricopeptide repeat-containing protein At4g21065-like [Syzygium oleosum]XP_056172418.1 pentatricopeptide repeat-containing protein At4g21065-like [Syzygium oleosum]